MGEVVHPIDGQLVLLAGAKASVSLTRLSGLLADVQPHLLDNVEMYDRQFERIEGTDKAVYYLAEDGYWESVGTELGLNDREIDAVRRAHEAQFERDGRRLDREAEFETTLEIRDVLAVKLTA